MDILKILVTTGASSEYNFFRLLKAIDSLCDKKIIDCENLIVQSTDQGYKPKNYKLCQMMPNDEFKTVMSNVDIVISHAGTGTIATALKMNKKLILFPRLKEYGELIDDHQLQICQLFADKGYVMLARNEEELKDCIINSNNFIPEIFVSNTDYFVNKLYEIIDSFKGK